MPRGTLAHVVALAVVLAIAAVGLCLFDVAHAPGGHPCPSFLVMMGGLFAAFSLAPIGRLLPARAKAYRVCPRDLPAPPPRT